MHLIGNDSHGRKQNVALGKNNHNRGQSDAGKALKPEAPVGAGGSSQGFSSHSCMINSSVG